MSQSIKQPALPAFSPLWGPFSGPQDAAASLTAFFDQTILDPTAGICWAFDNGQVIPLRLPRYNKDGEGVIITVKWNPVKAAPAVTMSQSSAFNDIKKALIDIVYIYSDSVNLGNQQQAFWSKDNNIKALEDSLIQRTRDDNLLNNAINKYGSDSFGLGCDFIGVAIALSVPVTGPIGFAALGGGIVLLILDGAMWSLEVSDNEAKSTDFKNRTSYIRLAAMVATLPDAIKTISKGLGGGYKSLINFLKKEKIPATKSSVNNLINITEKNQRKIEKLKLILQKNIIKLLSKDTSSVGLTAYSATTITEDELRPDNNDPAAKTLRHIHDFTFDIISGTKRK